MPSLSDYLALSNRPPGDASTMIGAWHGDGGDAVEARMCSIYTDLVTPADWPAGIVADHLEPTKLWDWLSDAWSEFTGQDNAHIDWPEGAPCLNSVARYYYDDGSEDTGTNRLESLGIASGEINPDDDGDSHFVQLATVKVQLSWLWSAYLTRCKLGMARATQFGYTPGAAYDGRYTDDNMAYDQLSSWWRVNKWVRANSELKAQVESYQPLKDAAAKMDTALQQFATATGVQMPAGATTVVGNRFPVSKAWWCGKLPSWYPATTDPQASQLDTLQIAKDFTRGAKDFRHWTGVCFQHYTQYTAHLDGSPL